MVGRRIERLNEQLKRELMEVLQYDVKDPRVGAVTITAVHATPDLNQARVFVNARGTEAERESSLEGLRAASSFLRGELSRRLRIRRVPELVWEIDLTLQHARRIEQLLGEVLPPAEPGGDAAAADGEDGGG
ncbi:MAG: 30S ribosome-binding factor RbfA [Longimicrobiales bacterium]